MVDMSLTREALSWVNPQQGTVDRRIFSDEQVYRLELEQIFARAWLFMAHESQIPNPGDFFQSYMGEDRVLVVRDRDGKVQVLLNSCRHRGNAVCRAEEGNVASFMCTYHGWTYDLDGKLIGVPGYKEVYHEELERESWGLIKAAQVDSYKDFIFATMDPAAPPLFEYLGETGRFGLNLLAGQGEMAIVPGVLKFTIQCNWKFATDNAFDFYHGVTHVSAGLSGWMSRSRAVPGALRPSQTTSPDAGPTTVTQRPGVVMLSDYGHAINSPYMPENWEEGAREEPALSWRLDPEVQRRITPTGTRMASGMCNIFPNMWVPTRVRQIALRLPKGPTTTEFWYFTFIDKQAAQDRRDAHREISMHTFGPAGLLEQDDGENWDQSTRGMRGVVASRYPLHYAMGLGHGEIVDDEATPPRIESHVNEHAQLWTYQAWSEWMGASSWADLQANHTRPEGIR